jgi:hypothetical protein
MWKRLAPLVWICPSSLTYVLNLSQCLAANGLSFNPGEEQMLTFLAVAGATDTAHQTASFKRK